MSPLTLVLVFMKSVSGVVIGDRLCVIVIHDLINLFKFFHASIHLPFTQENGCNGKDDAKDQSTNPGTGQEKTKMQFRLILCTGRKIVSHETCHLDIG